MQSLKHIGSALGQTCLRVLTPPVRLHNLGVGYFASLYLSCTSCGDGGDGAHKDIIRKRMGNGPTTRMNSEGSSLDTSQLPQVVGCGTNSCVHAN